MPPLFYCWQLIAAMTALAAARGGVAEVRAAGMEGSRSLPSIRLLGGARIGSAADYTVAQMIPVAVAHHIKLLLSMDAVRETIYGRIDAATQTVKSINDLAAVAARVAKVSWRDLTDTFQTNFAFHRTRFKLAFEPAR